MSKQSLATIGIAFLHPVFDALRALNCSDKDLSDRLGLHPGKLKDLTEALPSNQVYSFLEWATGRSCDPYFCARLGKHMANGGWAPILPILTAGGSVGDFLVRFSNLADRQGPAARYKLETEGEFALWRLTRPSNTRSAARFADAIAAGFFVEILKNATAESWSPSQTVLVLSDPDLVAGIVLPSPAVLAGAKGFSLRFPSEWLTAPIAEPIEDEKTAPKVPVAQPTADLIATVTQIIEVRIDEPDFGPEQLAESVGMARWRLQEAMRTRGTSFSEVRDSIRKRLAIEKLASSEETVAEIARSLGYTDASNFTRAFRKWTEVPPQVFRKKLRSV